MKIWFWLLPYETPNKKIIEMIVGSNPFLIKHYRSDNLDNIYFWLSKNCSGPVLLAPQYGNPMEKYQPYHVFYIYFKHEEDACLFKLCWGQQ